MHGSIKELINHFKEVKSRKFDQALWSDPHHRLEYSYKEKPGWRNEPGGVITYPCCPHCGNRRGPDNREFLRGRFCDQYCRDAWKIYYGEFDSIKGYIKRVITGVKCCLNGDGI